MAQNFKKKRLSTSDTADESGEFHRNPSTVKADQKALTVVQDLSWGSFLPLISVFIKHGPLAIYYQRASRGGLRLGTLLCFFKVSVSAPLKINDSHYLDTPHVTYWKIHYHVVKVCCDHLDRIEKIIQTHIPKCTGYVKKLLATNVGRAWEAWLTETLILRGTAKQLGKQEGVPLERVILISRYASLLKILKLDSILDNCVPIMPHPNQNKAMLYPFVAVMFGVWDVFLALLGLIVPRKTSSPNFKDPYKIGIAAAWGTEGMDKNQKDDLFWWRKSSVDPSHVIYMFEREDIQPTRNNVTQVQNLGIKSVALNSKFLGDNPGLLIKGDTAQHFLIPLQRLGLALKLGWKGLAADDFSRAVLALVSWQYFTGNKLSDIYKTLNLKVVFHFEDAGMDMISLASAMNDSIRIGTHWASHTGINQTSSRCHQVYFFWGRHDAQLVLDAMTTSRSLLIAGCFLSDHSNKTAYRDAQEAANGMRKRGARYILTLLDGSASCPNFYKFFLQWLVDDPSLGLLIKSKSKSWKEVSKNGLNGLVKRANNTNRIYIIDPKASPADATLFSDFAVGISSISALAVAALNESRVIFLDYERIDQGPQSSYCILHSLGLNRCVFYEPELLRQAVVDYFENPSANPNLGDATPILDQLDPFRDGKASQRIGEFVTSYLEALNRGSNSDDATRYATDKYAEKWGKDKVIRRS
jgi:hypothetical protein